MVTRLPPIRLLAALTLLAAIGIAGGCATNAPSLANVSTVDQQFVAAVLTWDLNHDGEVTCEEWKAYASGLFAEADTNKDGALTREEFAAMAREDQLFVSADFGYFDTNGDGRVTLAEIIDKPNPAFTLLDKDGDCVINRSEKAGERGAGKGMKGQGKRSKQ